ncbi:MULTISPECIES: XRE family transcriptional regulator [unclassified Crossiella]|uniref:XRE family transcriptional regulator n=1 Tax=unclassified Crossiella TaxID=2620835 RepID=UPI001FFF6A01|nr:MULTISPECIES: XRE family transcriptional regulator [unclassified Crossiella]MCK2237828.1 XRE family transcriptional regulator [Crossiella sp. S99.2]MCK2255114.1 XRE family transcriptional regulator [Crossiella sp. S99.1]
MPNERLRDALLRKGFSPADVADKLRVDHKTVERWITKGRTPYAKYRHSISVLVHESENYLWPDAIKSERSAEVAESEVVKVYPHRHTLPRDVWDKLLRGSNERIDVLVYAGLFMTEDPGMIKNLRGKAMAGTRIRIALGDPDSEEVEKRSLDENIGPGTLGAKVRNALAFFGPLKGESGIEIRCHSTILYNSIYRFDQDMLVNTHVYGFMAAHAPVMHLRQLSVGTLFETYSESFEAVWKDASAPKW